MSAPLALILQSAPEADGDVALDTTGWTGATIAITGVYEDDDNETYTGLVSAGGTIGTTATITIVVTRSSDGTTFRLNLGTDHSYSLGDTIAFDDHGLSISFSTSTTITATQTFTVTAVAHRRVRADHQIITHRQDAGAGVRVPTVSMNDRDRTFRMEDESVFREIVAMLREPRVDLDWINAANKLKLLRMAHGRHLVTIGEDYDQDTVFLLRGGGIRPLIGCPLTFSRSGPASYRDAESGLWKLAADGVPRLEEGPFGGHALVAGTQQLQNDDTRFHPTGSGTAVERGWTTQAGSPVPSWDPRMRGVLHPQGGWQSKFLQGTLRYDMPAASAIRTNVEPSVVSGQTQIAQVTIRGRGRVQVSIYDDPSGSPVEIAGEDVVLGEGRDWTYVDLIGTAVSSTNKHIRITATEKSTIWLSAKQQHQNFRSGGFVETDGSVATRNVETLQLTNFVLPPSFTIAMWFRMPAGSYALCGAPLPFLEEVTAGDLVFRYEEPSPGPRLRLGMDQVTIMNGNLGSPLLGEQWYQVVATVNRSTATANEAQLGLYLNGALVNSNDLAFDFQPIVGTAVYQIGKSFVTHRPMMDWRIGELRIDARAWNAQDVLRHYARMTDGRWQQIHMETAGRAFWIDANVGRPLSDVHQDLRVETLALIEAMVHSDSLVTRR